MSKYADIMKELDIPYLGIGSTVEYTDTEKVLRNRIDLLTGVLRGLLDELDTDERAREVAASFKDY